MRSPGRRRPKRVIRAYGKYWNCGPQAEDAVSGWVFPIREMVRQRGRLVSPDEADGSIDKPDTY